MSKTIKIYATDGDVLFDGNEPDDQFIIELEDVHDYDNYEAIVREVLDLNIDGPTAARILLLLSHNFLNANGEVNTLSSAELREQS